MLNLMNWKVYVHIGTCVNKTKEQGIIHNGTIGIGL